MRRYNLAGTGVPHHSVTSRRWFQAAADQGEPMAALQLGKMYATGRLGVERDYRLAKTYLVLCLRGIEGRTESIEVMARAEAVAHLAGGVLRTEREREGERRVCVYKEAPSFFPAPRDRGTLPRLYGGTKRLPWSLCSDPCTSVLRTSTGPVLDRRSGSARLDEHSPRR